MSEDRRRGSRASKIQRTLVGGETELSLDSCENDDAISKARVQAGREHFTAQDRRVKGSSSEYDNRTNKNQVCFVWILAVTKRGVKLVGSGVCRRDEEALGLAQREVSMLNTV